MFEENCVLRIFQYSRSCGLKCVLRVLRIAYSEEEYARSRGLKCVLRSIGFRIPYISYSVFRIPYSVFDPYSVRGFPVSELVHPRPCAE